MSKISNALNQMRKVAEDQLALTPMKLLNPLPGEDLLHELQVHQIELEMQNDELRKTQLIIEEMRDRYVDLYEFAPVGYFTLTCSGMIAEVNLTGAALLGVDRKALLNRRFARFVSPEDGNQWDQHFLNVLQHDGRQHCELTLLGSDGSCTQVRVTSLKANDSLSSIEIDDLLRSYDPANNSPMLRVVVTDITERIAGEVLLSAVEERYRILYESMDEGYCVVEMIFDTTGKPVDYRYIEVNPAFEKNTGLQHALGKTIREMAPDHESHWFEIYGQVAKTGEAIRFENVAIAMSRYYDVYAFRVGDKGSNKVGILFRDITERRSAEELVKKSEANFQAMLDNSPYLTWLKDSSGRYIKINKVYAQNLRLDDASQVIGKTDFDMHPEELAEKYLADDVEVMVSRQRKHVEEPVFDGQKTYWVETYKTPVFDNLGTALGTVGFAQDITERKRRELDLRIAAVAFETQEAMMIADHLGVIMRVNKAFTKITGYTAEEAVGNKPSMLKSGRHDAEFYRSMWKTIQSTGAWQGEIWDRRKNGEVYPKWLTISAVRGEDGAVTHYVGSHFDITERKVAEEKIRNLSLFDPLTELPNRQLLIDRLEQAIASGARSDIRSALLFIDLDNFKIVNDTLGHEMGNLMLREVAHRLNLCVREHDSVARLGGDEFVVLLEGLSASDGDAAKQAETVAEKIRTSLNQPYLLGLHEHHGSCSIGVALFKDAEQGTEELIKQADMAMYQAKKTGRNTLRFFDPKMQEIVTTRALLESELRKAIDRKQLELHYQIQVDSSSIPTGAEALIRWIHPERGMVSPAQFIPLAEETGLILPIGLWVLETACATLKVWEQDTLTQDLVLSINVSAKQFRQPDFVSQVQEVVERYEVNPDRLKLELTESMLLDDIETMIATMSAINQLGIRFSLDDFGTGYSSLQYLKRLPLNQLKIDQSFVRDLVDDESDKAIVRTIIAMAHSLRLNVIAEGVETEGQRDVLLSKGCAHYQGYLFSKPVPIKLFQTLLKQSLNL